MGLLIGMLFKRSFRKRYAVKFSVQSKECTTGDFLKGISVSGGTRKLNVESPWDKEAGDCACSRGLSALPQSAPATDILFLLLFM